MFVGAAVVWAVPLEAQHERFRAGTIPILNVPQTQVLRDRLASGSQADWSWVLNDYLGVIHDSSLANLMVYLPDTGTIRQSLIWKGSHRTWLPGRQHLWVIVFAEEVALPGAEEGHGDLSITLTSLDYQKDRFLVALLKGLAGGLMSGATPEPHTSVEEETVLQVGLEPVSSGDVNRPLYMGIRRFDLAENTSNRISIRPASNEPFPADRSAHYNFGNASGSAFGVSLAGGFTFGAASDEFFGTQPVGRTADIRMSFYLFGHLYFRRPRLPWSGWSVSLAGGTNVLRGGILDDVVAGLSFGGIVGDVGIITGVNLLEFRELEDAVVKTNRKARLFVGVDFAL
jgi:hypothetical protein